MKGVILDNFHIRIMWSSREADFDPLHYVYKLCGSVNNIYKSPAVGVTQVTNQYHANNLPECATTGYM